MDVKQFEKTKETTINIKELLMNIFQKWYVLCICMILGAILLLGWKLAKNNAVDSVRITDVDPTADYSLTGNYQQEMLLFRSMISNYGKLIASDTATENKKIADEYKKIILDMIDSNEADKEYLEGSILYKISDSTFYKASLSVLFQNRNAGKSGSDETISEDIQSLRKLYRERLLDTSIYEELASQWNTKPLYIAELVTVDELNGSNSSNNSGIVLEAEYGNNISISVRQADAEKVQVLLDYLLKELEDYQQELNEQGIAHSIRTVSTAAGTAMDRTIAVKKQELQNKVAVFDALAERFETYRTYVERDGAGNQESAGTSKVSLKTLVKYGGAGLVAGLILGIILLILYYLIAGIVFSRDEVNRTYGLRPLMVFQKRKNGKELKGLPKWIEEKKESKQIRSLTREQRYDLTAVNIQPAMNSAELESEIKEIVITGVASAETINELAEQLQKRMEGVSFKALQAPMINAKEAEQLSSADAIVLVVELDTKRREIEDYMQLISNQHVRILGTVTM